MLATIPVALLAEGVDRNQRDPLFPAEGKSVALLAEGVDRNDYVSNTLIKTFWSPSSRRAWIEICGCLPVVLRSAVALLAEGVDRNEKLADALREIAASPSSRRAWIEIPAAIRI